MDRRTFLAQATATGALLMTGTLIACDGKDTGGTGTTGSTTGSATGTSTGAATGAATGTGTGAATGTGTGAATGTGTGTGSGTGSCNTVDATAGDSEGHSHNLVIPMADWQAGTGGTYSISGGSHGHSVDLTAQDMADLAANCTVTVTSSDTHPHTWVISIP